jgi:hypothetical protein
MPEPVAAHFSQTCQAIKPIEIANDGPHDRTPSLITPRKLGAVRFRVLSRVTENGFSPVSSGWNTRGQSGGKRDRAVKGGLKGLIPDRRPIAAWISATAQNPLRSDRDAVGVAGLLIPWIPAMDGMAALLKRAQCIRRKPVLHVKGVARFAEAETTGQESRQLDGFLMSRPKSIMSV